MKNYCASLPGARGAPTFGWLRGPRQFALLPMVACLALFWPFSSGKHVQMLHGKLDPAARGTVSVKTGKNGNTALDIKARSLAPPSGLNPSENVYVVWVQPPGQDAKNLGALTVDGNENAELKTKTPYKSFKVFITAEAEVLVQKPTGPEMLSASVEQG
jgi:hypothetical protein